MMYKYEKSVEEMPNPNSKTILYKHYGLDKGLGEQWMLFDKSCIEQLRQDKDRIEYLRRKKRFFFHFYA